MGNKIGRFYVDLMSMHQEVTGSCILCVVRIPNTEKRIKFIIDCGMFQEEEYSEYNKKLLFNSDELDFACITHAHVDHIGRLPLLTAKGFAGNIYCSNGTAELLPYSLHDCWKVLKETAKRKHEKRIYDENDVDEMLKVVKSSEFGQTMQVNDFIKVTFFENGHLYGASVVLVQIEYFGEESINLLFSGDYNSHNMFFNIESLPQWVKELSLNVIVESTYGYMTTEEIKPCFEENLLEAIQNKKNIIIPAFSLGRGQEILYLLKQYQLQKKLSTEVAIFYCGKLGIRYTKEIFKNNISFNVEAQEFIPQNITFVDKSNKEQMYSDTRQKIIVGSSGMGTYGPMQTVIPYFIQTNALIHFTGYCAEGTLGRRLHDTEMDKVVELSGISVKKKADVKFTNEFSAHAKSDELVDFLKQFKNLDTVLINHGSFESKEKFAQKVLEEIECKDVVILNRAVGFRLKHFGLQKPLNTKFI